jgi:hypothetical protein
LLCSLDHCILRISVIMTSKIESFFFLYLDLLTMLWELCLIKLLLVAVDFWIKLCSRLSLI